MEIDVRKLTTDELNKLIEDIEKLKNRASRELIAFRAKADIDRKIIKDYLNSDMTHKQVAELNGVSMSKVKKTLDHLASAFYLSNHDDIDYDKAMSIKGKVGCKSPKLQETINEFVKLYTS